MKTKSIIAFTMAFLSLAFAADENFLRQLARDRCPNRDPSLTGRGRCNMNPGVQCGYGQESCCGETYDATICECFDRRWACRPSEACRVPPCQCPLDIPEFGGSCTVPEGQDCSYGTETCCGETYDSLVCNCLGGTWACYNTDACFAPPCQQCPAETPNSGDKCTVPSYETCGYGSESCCGETFDSIQCTCGDDGYWACLATDACFFPPCEQEP